VTVTVRACSTKAEKRRSLEIYNEVRPRRSVTMEDMEAWERASIASADFLAAVGGVDAGSAAASVDIARPHICLMFVTVLPHHRRRGVGAALFETVAEWAAEHGTQELETQVDPDADESVAFARHRGFRDHSREVGFELALSDREPPAVDAPDGIEIVLLADHPDLASAAYDVGVEALPDVPGSEDWSPPPVEQFLATHLRGLAIFLAVSEGEVVGYAKLSARPDGLTVEHGMTAVKRAWRGRGIAKALKRAQIVWAHANGIERLTATNEERNVAMQRVNESLGYRPAPGRLQLRAPIGGASARAQSR
jgi:GNAT superfamily N-acetyltransferase